MAWRGHRGLDTTGTKQLLLDPTANVTRATCASPAPAYRMYIYIYIYLTRTHSLHTGMRQRYTCIFLVITPNKENAVHFLVY